MDNKETTGKIVINGDNEQTDIQNPTGELNGLSYAIELSLGYLTFYLHRRM